MGRAMQNATSVHVVNAGGGAENITVDSRGRLDGTSFTAKLTGTGRGVAQVTRIGDDYYAYMDLTAAKAMRLNALLPVGHWYRPDADSGRLMAKGSSPLELEHPVLMLAHATDLPDPVAATVAGRTCWVFTDRLTEGVLTLTVDRATQLPVSVALDGHAALTFDSWNTVEPAAAPAGAVDLRGSARTS